MKQLKVTGLCLVAMFTFGAITAVSANAAAGERVWTVEGKTLATGKTKELKIKEVTKATELKVTSAGENIVCKTVTLIGGTIENVSVNSKVRGRDKGTIEFSNCKNTGSSTKEADCKVKEPIVVKGTTSLAETTGASPKIVDVFFPEKGGELEAGKTKAEQEKLYEFAKIEQSGTGCTAPAATTVESDGVAAEISPGSESTTQTLNFPSPPVTPVKLANGLEVTLTLKAFGVKAEEVGTVVTEITAKEKFGVA